VYPVSRVGEDLSLSALRGEAQRLSAGLAGITESEDGGMKLSDAIRLGAMMKPQAFEGWADTGGSCALLAAAEACGMEPRINEIAQRPSVDYDALRERFPMLTAALICEVFKRNDSLRQTREEIADFIATLEAQQEHPAQPVEVTA
jgi:hypothetical protein